MRFLVPYRGNRFCGQGDPGFLLVSPNPSVTVARNGQEGRGNTAVSITSSRMSDRGVGVGGGG